MTVHKQMEKQRSQMPRNPGRRTVHFIAPRAGKKAKDYYATNTYYRTRFGNLVKVKD